MLTGVVFASGAQANGIYAQSTGQAGGQDISVTINPGGASIGGVGTGTGLDSAAGVVIVGGSNNTVTNYGGIASQSNITGYAIIGGSNNNKVDNYGTVIGSVDLGPGTNAFNNKNTGVFDSGEAIFLGAGNTFLNAGTAFPGGIRACPNKCAHRQSRANPHCKLVCRYHRRIRLRSASSFRQCATRRRA